MNLTAALGANYRYRHAGDGEIRVDCPYCGDRKGHLYINRGTGAWICFRCGQSGRENKLAGKSKQAHPPAPTADAVALFMQKMFPSREQRQPGMAMPSWTRAIRSEAPLNYLSRRGITPAAIDGYKLRQTTDEQFIMAPFYEQGAFVYYQLRGVDSPLKKNPTKVEANGFGKADFLFGYDQAKGSDRLVLVEGWADAIIAGAGAMAIQGKSLSRTQAKKVLSMQPACVTVMLDGDDDTTGQAVVAAKVLHSLSDGLLDIRLADLGSTGKDPADIGWDGCQAAIAAALPIQESYKLAARKLSLDKHTWHSV